MFGLLASSFLSANLILSKAKNLLIGCQSLISWYYQKKKKKISLPFIIGADPHPPFPSPWTPWCVLIELQDFSVYFNVLSFSVPWKGLQLMRQ